jgi:phospholipase/carboxylesterase
MGRFQQPISWNPPTDSGNTSKHHTTKHQDAGLEPEDHDSVFESDQSEDGSQEFSLDATSWSRPASHRSFFLPLHYTPSYDYPLVVWLHSNGFNENQIDHVMPYISLRNYVGVGIRGNRAADSIGHRFDWHQSPGAISAAHEAICEAIDDALGRFSVNPSRIVLAGYQQGGTMAMRIAMRDPDRFAGAISLGGRMPRGAIRNVHELRRRELPMLWQWSVNNPEYTDDNLKSDCRSVMMTRGQVEVRQYPSDDEMDTVVLRDLNEWIMRRIVSGSCSGAHTDRWASSPTSYSSN